MFIEETISDTYIKRRKLIYGVATNDADYFTSKKINGKVFVCPYYARWFCVLNRCLSDKFKTNNPAYKDCSVCDEWLVFSNFKLWMKKQDWNGKELDKDLLIQGNKIYSPHTCLFVSKRINTMLLNCKAKRGLYKVGVSLFKRNGRFAAACHDYAGKKVNIGHYDSEQEAHEAYKVEKYKSISIIANEQQEPLKSALLRYTIQEY